MSTTRLYYPLDERVPRLRHAPDSRLFHTTYLLNAEERKSSATYNEALVRGHAQDSVHVRLDGPQGEHDSLAREAHVRQARALSRQAERVRLAPFAAASPQAQPRG